MSSSRGEDSRAASDGRGDRLDESDGLAPIPRDHEVIEDGVVVTFAPRQAALTDTPLDVLAALVLLHAPDPEPALHPEPDRPRTAILGVGAGGILAPIRALGVAGPIAGADLDLAALAAARTATEGWAGRVSLDAADAVEWLRGREASFDVVVDDLSVGRGLETTKPWASVATIPHLAARRLAPDGAFCSNLLPWPGVTMEALAGNVAAPFPASVRLEFEDWENVVLVAAESLPPPGRLEESIRAALRTAGSGIAERFTARGAGR